MLKPDLIITQIAHCDYPIWRKWLKQYSQFFDTIIIYFSYHNRFPHFAHFIQGAIQRSGVTNVIYLDPIETDWATQDWRNVSTNHMLNYSDAEWVCSIEQDWFVKDWEKLLLAVVDAMESRSFIGWWQESNNYIHPSFWFIKRELLEKTSKDFAAHDKHDHFGWISDDVQKIAGNDAIMTTQEMGFKDFEDCFHLGGVNQNYLEGMKNEYVFHRPDIFSAYNYWSQKVGVEHNPRHMQLCQQIATKLPEPDPKWEAFFK